MTAIRSEVPVQGFAVTATVGVLVASAFSFGEEFGWRGFLGPELAKVTSFGSVADTGTGKVAVTTNRVAR